ncbi:hypothetical protein [Pelagicoccus sp. SDUM812002]|uniref:hypothetical protein n=1 Tax=Pelagicoccus sp. SDUM812002 TaxID=3041266 RepID=UPI0028109169|nr:hypothetical protein [Pelagicoccus sp. SDUM812002]MDQ8188504.1 hypothetical protein [Pelagicoccus sp. SDUM812002]
MPRKMGWIGVDLDGTLAEYTAWKGLEHIGKPIPLMMQRVQDWIKEGYTIRIMTARASVEGGAEPVGKWLSKHGLPDLAVTNSKDFEMIELWDDRAIQVVTNTGQPIIRPDHFARPKVPLLRDEKGGETCEIVK